MNQYGGYTGMTAADFMAWLSHMAAEAGVQMDQLILGGDHLGPNAWKAEPLDVAMEKSRELVKSYVQAGFKKIHLDTNMACGGETEEPDALDVTSVDRFRDTIQSHRDAWSARGLNAAWSRIVSVVT